MARRGSKAGKKSVRTADTTTLPLFAQAMRQQPVAEDLAQVSDRPDFISCGLPSVDEALRGGLGLGTATLIAARAQVGATSFLMGATLAALKRGERVAYFSERLREDQLRGRFVVLESRVNGHRFRAGFVSAEDRIALAAARERIPWGNLNISARKRLEIAQIDTNVFSYRPWLVVADVSPRTQGPASAMSRRQSILEGVERLASLARKHRVALLARMTLPRGQHPPDILELPALGAASEAFDSVVLLHRQLVTPEGEPDHSGEAEARIVRVGGREVSTRTVPLRFDHRFAGLLEP